MPASFDLSVIVTTWNSVEWVEKCLQAFLEQENVHFEIIAVDNGSTDGTQELIRRTAPGAKCIFLSSNLGPAKARNLAIEQAQGRYVLTLDHDVVLEKDFLRDLVSSADAAEEQVGMWSGKILRPDRKTIDSTGIILDKRWRAWDRKEGNGAILGPSACAALYRRSMLEEIKDEYGYFDERFFFLWEDVELAWRAQQKGWKAAYVPSAVAVHARNGSRLTRRQRQTLSLQNRYLFIKKHRLWRPLHRYLLHCGGYEISRLAYVLLTNPSAFGRRRELKEFEDRARV